MSCEHCGVALSDGKIRRHARFCSKQCSMTAYTRRRYNANAGMNPDRSRNSATGAIGELAVVVDLMSRGFDVFLATDPSCACDLVYLGTTGAVRVQVRSGYRSLSGALYFPQKKKDAGRHDLWAVVVHNDPREILYLDLNENEVEP